MFPFRNGLKKTDAPFPFLLTLLPLREFR